MTNWRYFIKTAPPPVKWQDTGVCNRLVECVVRAGFRRVGALADANRRLGISLTIVCFPFVWCLLVSVQTPAWAKLKPHRLDVNSSPARRKKPVGSTSEPCGRLSRTPRTIEAKPTSLCGKPVGLLERTSRAFEARQSGHLTSSNCRSESPREGFSSVYIIERDFLILYI